MKKIAKILLWAFVAHSALAAALDVGVSSGHGVVTFDVKPVSIKHSEYQPVSSFGCNNVSKTINKLEWGTTSSHDLVYGWQEGDGRAFFVAQYYLASPPVPADPQPDQRTTLGLLHPDHFKFKGLQPREKVRLDYSLLNPVFLGYVNIDYGSCNGKVDSIPINTVCPKFPYKNGEMKLASGIGVLENKAGQRRIFLPTLEKHGKKPLQCNVSILNDIQLNYTIRFSIGELVTDNLNLTQQFTHHSDVGVSLICDKRPEDAPLPSGCVPAADDAGGMY